MAETAEVIAIVPEKTPEVVTPVSPFSNDAWKNAPAATVVEEVKPTEELKKVEDEIFDEAVYVKQHFGVESVEDAKKELADLRAKASTPAEIKFANEESEKLYNYLLSGEPDKALDIYAEQKKLKEVDKLPPADIIKLDLQYKNKDFSSDDINELFSERYQMPEKPVQDLETDEEFAAKLEKYEKEVQKVEGRIKRDAKPAVTELLKLQKEIVLPDIPKQKVETLVNEPTQEELDAQKAWGETFLKSVNEGVQKFKGYESTFKDEEVELKVAYVPTEDERKELQPIIALSGTDAGAFMEKLGWVDKDGNINTAKLAEDLPFILNKEKVLNKMVSETGNKRHEASIKAIKNIDYSGNGKSNGELGATPQQLQGSLVNHFFSQ